MMSWMRGLSLKEGQRGAEQMRIGPVGTSHLVDQDG